jgi:hypothetical protein
MNQPFLYEFLYRGRPPGSAEAPAWHVVLGQHVMPPGGTEPQFVASGALTPAQAEAAGFPLSAAIGEINASALAERDAAMAALAALRQECDELRAQIAAMQSADG